MWLSMGDSSCHCPTSCGKNNKQTTVAKQKQQRHKEKEEDGKEWGEEYPQTDADSEHSSPQKDEMPGIVWATKLMVLMPSGWLSSPPFPHPSPAMPKPLLSATLFPPVPGQLNSAADILLPKTTLQHEQQQSSRLPKWHSSLSSSVVCVCEQLRVKSGELSSKLNHNLNWSPVNTSNRMNYL